jgi:TRAP-type C4-dicarboxylate transport system permease small subunit
MTRKMLAVLGSALFLIIAPGIVAGLVPWWISKWNAQPPFLGFAPMRALGALLLVVSVLVLLESFSRLHCKA